MQLLSFLIKELSSPRAYNHPVNQIRVAQTHISCVFLTGSFAYKIKKPVRFAFLDYSTLEKRHEMCRKEVELNRRLCPSVYLDVVPVAQRKDGLQVGGPGEIIEWAVRMIELPESEMLSQRLKSDRIDETEIRSLARVLRDFHDRAADGAEISKFGTPEMISRNVEENFSETESISNHILPGTQLKMIEKFTREFIKDYCALFWKRIEKNSVRDGHGDLRIQNICLDSGVDQGIQIFDCIEFNQRLRCLDVLCDVAYLAMDLDLAGRSDLRQLLIKEYSRDSSSDVAKLFRFYCCYRAYVRGKIALFASQEREVPADERKTHADIAAAAFDLATSYTSPLTEKPVICMMHGFSGSGKSVLAYELARRIPAVLISSDVVRKHLANAPQKERLGNEWYTPDRIAAVYDRMRAQARDWIAAGENVILDATFLSADERTKTTALAAGLKIRLWILDCVCTDSVIRQRLRDRRIDASDADVAVYESQLSYQQPLIQSETLHAAQKYLQINTEQDPATIARHVLLETLRH